MMLDDQRFALIHREGQRLDDEVIAIPVDDQSRKAVAFAPDQPARPAVEPAAAPVVGRQGDAASEEIGIEILALTRKTARDDLRAGVVDGAPQHPVAPVLEGDDISGFRAAEGFEHIAGIDPVVSM